MGTRANIRVKDVETDEVLVCLYNQMDGYPSYLGKRIQEFTNSGKLVNGISASDVRLFNGLYCYAASLVAFLKVDEGEIRAGGIYLFPPTHEVFSADEDYCYDISIKDNRFWVDVNIQDYDTKEITTIISGFMDEVEMKD